MRTILTAWILSAIAGGLASYFGGIGAVVAVVIGELAMLLMSTPTSPEER